MNAIVFRLFVSSTFSDMRAERDVLHERVWPRLRAFCTTRGARFQAVDLRWGISEDAGRDQQTLAICLDEIRRCQQVGVPPNFLILLGDRYGWRPVPASVPAELFDRLLAKLPELGRGVIRECYRRDENAYPAIYRLLPWGERSADEIDRLSRRLRGLWTAAMDLAGWHATDPQRHAFEASATHQEILLGALEAAGAERHVLGYLRQLSGLAEGGAAAHPYGDYLGETRDESAVAAIANLREQLRAMLPASNRREHQAALSAWPDPAAVRAFADWVAGRLESLIVATLQTIAQTDDRQREIDAHRAFAVERAQHFVGRAAELRSIADYLTTSQDKPLVAYGPSGSGKSALCARVGTDAPSKTVVVRRFVGATPASTQIRTLLTSICGEIAAAYGDERPVPQDLATLRDDLPVRLALATAERPLVVVVDGLDQLTPDEDSRREAWVPWQLPPHAKLVLALLAEKEPAEGIPLLRLSDLSADEGAELLRLWLTEAGRALQPSQRDVVLAGFAGCPRPLYLRLAFEAARRWPSDHKPEPLAADVGGVIRQLFDRLEAGVNHGPALVGRTLGYLAAARNGLSESELIDVLSADPDVMDEFVARSPTERAKPPEARLRRLPDAVWSRLFYDLRPYLAERDGDGSKLLGFYHRQLGQEAADRYLTGESCGKAHASLATYFAGLPYFQGTRPVLRKATELFWQRLRAARATGTWDEVVSLALTPAHLESKAEAGMAYELTSELRECAADLPESEPTRNRIRTIAATLSRESNLIATHPDLLFQTAWNAAWSREGMLPWLQGWRTDRLTRNVSAPWFRSVLPAADDSSALRAVLRGHDGAVQAVAITPDGKTVVSGSRDGTARIWDAATGRPRTTVRMGGDRNEMLSQGITGVAISPAGDCVLTTGQDLAADEADGVLFWDATTGRQIDRMPATAGLRLHNVALSEDASFFAATTSGGGGVLLWRGAEREPVRLGEAEGRMGIRSLVVVGLTLVSTSWNGPLQAWRADTAEELWSIPLEEGRPVMAIAVAESNVIAMSYGRVQVVHHLSERRLMCQVMGHDGVVGNLALTPDGNTLITGGDDHFIKLWDTATGKERGTLSGHEGRIQALALTPDGRTLVSGSADGTVRVWDLTRPLASTGADAALSGTLCVAVSGDGGVVVTGHADKVARLWDPLTGTERQQLIGHARKVRAVAVTPDGHTVVTGSSDGTARVWDANTGACQRVLGPHNRPVLVVAVTADGQGVATGDENTVRVWDVEGRLLWQAPARYDDVTPSMDDPRAELAGVVSRVEIRPADQNVVIGGEARNLFGRWDPRAGRPYTSIGGMTEPDPDRPPQPTEQPPVTIEQQLRELMEQAEREKPRMEDLQHAPLVGLAFTAGGRVLASGTSDLFVRVWDCATGGLTDMICGAYVRPPYTPRGEWDAVPEEFTTALQRADGTPRGRVLGRMELADASADGTIWAGVANGQLLLLRAESDGQKPAVPPVTELPFASLEARFGKAAVASVARLTGLMSGRWRRSDVREILARLGVAVDFEALWSALRPYLVRRGIEGECVLSGPAIELTRQRYAIDEAAGRGLLAATLAHLDALPEADVVRQSERLRWLLLAGRTGDAARLLSGPDFYQGEFVVLMPALARLARSPDGALLIVEMLREPGLDDDMLERLHGRLELGLPSILERTSAESYLVLLQAFIAYLTGLVARSPRDLRCRREIALNLGRIGRMFRDLGDARQSLRYLEMAAQRFQELTQLDPREPSRWEDLFVALHQLRLLFDSVRDIPTASRYARASWDVLCLMRQRGMPIASSFESVYRQLEEMYG